MRVIAFSAFLTYIHTPKLRPRRLAKSAFDFTIYFPALVLVGFRSGGSRCFVSLFSAIRGVFHHLPFFVLSHGFSVYRIAKLWMTSVSYTNFARCRFYFKRAFSRLHWCFLPYYGLVLGGGGRCLLCLRSGAAPRLRYIQRRSFPKQKRCAIMLTP